ncbi:hypothetical protein Mal35_16740 [Gimesia maris]|uniref:hypothetical protein n=1 Tax=Gimesia maris TaxID=122 RepID=UPI001187D3F2|nr:hypothetical protein [Gimesia maris]QDT78242.1 hypothetical protein Mal35_16740 [Gimesia maris]
MLNQIVKWWLLFLGVPIAIFGFVTSSWMIDPKAIFGNILAEAAGVLAGALFTLLIVDGLLRRDRINRWMFVRESVYESVSAHMCDIAMAALNHFEIESDTAREALLGTRDWGDNESLMAIEEIERRMNQIQSDANSSRKAVLLFDAITFNLTYLGQVLLPRAILATEDSELINALVSLDHSIHPLMRAKRIQQVMPGPLAYERTKELIREVHGIYDVLARRHRDE